MNKRWLVPLGAVILVAAVALWYWQGRDRPLDPVGKVRFAASLTLSPIPIWLAHERGFFQQAGVESELVTYDTGKATTEALLKGEVDLSASAEFLVARLSFQHPNLRMLSTLSFVHQIRLLGLKEKGLHSVADLKGMRVGVTLGTNGEYFLARLLSLNGLARPDIQWVDLKPQAMEQALVEGRVDGVLVWPPFVQQLERALGDRLSSTDGQPGQDYYYALIGRQDWLAANPARAERVLLALDRAVAWMEAHPQEAQAYIAAKLGLDLKGVSEASEGTRFAITLPQALLTAVESESQWLERNPNTKGKRVANSLELIEMAPLRAVLPARVTIVPGSAR